MQQVQGVTLCRVPHVNVVNMTKNYDRRVAPESVAVSTSSTSLPLVVDPEREGEERPGDEAEGEEEGGHGFVHASQLVPHLRYSSESTGYPPSSP